MVALAEGLLIGVAYVAAGWAARWVGIDLARVPA